ncbi:hypothetical protein ACLKA7_013498 [Drosophila subpalustris]
MIGMPTAAEAAAASTVTAKPVDQGDRLFVGKKAEFLAHYNTFCLGCLVEGEASGSKAGLSLRLRLRQLPPTPGGI